MGEVVRQDVERRRTRCFCIRFPPARSRTLVWGIVGGASCCYISAGLVAVAFGAEGRMCKNARVQLNRRIAPVSHEGT